MIIIIIVLKYACRVFPYFVFEYTFPGEKEKKVYTKSFITHTLYNCPHLQTAAVHTRPKQRGTFQQRVRNIFFSFLM